MPGPVTANDLRWLGEEADGKRGKDYVVVWKKDSDFKRLGLAPRNNLAGDMIAESIDVITNLEGNGLLGDAKIQLDYRGTTITKGLEGADSIFTTQSAFSKFVIPYYTRFKTPNEIGWMKFNFFEDGFIGVAHFPPSVPLGVGVPFVEGAKAPILGMVTSSGEVTPLRP